MSLFTQTLVDHLAKELSVKDTDIYDALDSFCGVENAEKDSKKDISVKKSKGTSVSSITKIKIPENKKTELKTTKKSSDKPEKDKHFCQRIKRGQTDECGKNATRSLQIRGKTMWLCGSEKSCCYFAELKNQASASVSEGQNKNLSKNKKNDSATKKVTKEPPKKPTSILETVLQQKRIDTISVQTKKHGKLNMEKNKRLLVDRHTKEFYGVLDEDGETIKELSKKDIAWIESTGHCVRPDKPKKQKEFKGRDDKTKKDDKKKSKKSVEESSSTSSESTKSSSSDEESNNASSKSDDHEELSDEFSENDDEKSSDSTSEELID
jgi:hypothetical protein